MVGDALVGRAVADARWDASGPQQARTAAGVEGNCEYRCNGDVERRLSCELGTCVYFEGDVQIAECPPEDVCSNLDTIDEYAEACCGWT